MENISSNKANGGNLSLNMNSSQNGRCAVYRVIISLTLCVAGVLSKQQSEEWPVPRCGAGSQTVGGGS